MKRIRFQAWRIIIRAWPIVFSVLVVWAALATIAPQWFQVHQGVAVTGFLLHPATTRILVVLTVIWIVAYLRRLESRPDLQRLESRLEALEKRPKAGSFGDVAQSLIDKGLLDAPLTASKIPDSSTVTILNRLLSRGDELWSTTRSITTGTPEVTQVECKHALEDIVKWEQEVLAWLNSPW